MIAMARGDVVHGPDGEELVIYWDGGHDSPSLIGPRTQYAQQLYVNGDVEGRPFRRGAGAERLVYRRRHEVGK
jgi:hypothetical protein